MKVVSTTNVKTTSGDAAGTLYIYTHTVNAH